MVEAAPWLTLSYDDHRRGRPRASLQSSAAKTATTTSVSNSIGPAPFERSLPISLFGRTGRAIGRMGDPPARRPVGGRGAGPKGEGGPG
jgi:hypothetical protein